MSDEEANAGSGEEEPPKKKSKALLFGLLGALLLGGGAFYGVFSGLIPLPFGEKPAELAEHADTASGDKYGKEKEAEEAGAEYVERPAAAFVQLDDLVISLGPNARSRHLKMVLSVEVDPEAEQGVTAVKPRISDVLNTYLRAIDEREIEAPRAMLRIRAQMLRRVQLVTPQDSVRDLLIQEFVLN